jgi:hypothetical protein
MQLAGERVSHPGSKIAVITLIAGLILTGCADSNFNLTSKDAVGTWEAGSGLSTEVTLSRDGTFVATAWPATASCDHDAPMTVDGLADDVPLAFGGRWEEGGGAATNTLTFYPDTEICKTSSFWADFRDEDHVKYACIPLGGGVEGRDAEDWFILYLGNPKDTPDSDACFNYG